MQLISRNLIIDTQYFLTKNLDFDSIEFQSLSKLVEGGLVKVFLTDITNREIIKKIDDELKIAYSKLSASDMRYLKKIPLFKRFLTTYDQQKAIRYFEDRFETFKQQCRITILDSSAINILNIYDDYCKHQPPFGQKFKKNEFPDAFALATIHHWAKTHNEKAYLLSGDKDWETYAQQIWMGGFSDELRFAHLSELSVFTDLVLRTENALKDLVAFSDDLITRKLDIIQRAVFKALSNAAFASDADDEDVDIIDQHFLSCSILDKEVVAISREGAVYSIDFSVDAIFEYEVPNYEESPYDPEEKEYIAICVDELYCKQSFEQSLEIEISFKEGLEANFTIETIEEPDEIVIDYDDKEIIDLDEWTSQLPVIVCGVDQGKITEDGSGYMEFANLADAHKVFPTLQIDNASKEFTKAMDNKILGPLRFETWKANDRYSGD